MDKHIYVLAFLLLILAESKVIIQNLEDDFTPKDELDYVNYLKIILGRQDQSTKVSESLIQITANKRYSLQNAVERVVIAFIPYASQKDEKHTYQSSKEIEFKGRLLQQLIFETPQLFIITSLPANQEQRIHQLIKAYKSEGKVVHVIRGEAKQVGRLGNMMNMELPEYQDRIHHPTRRLAEVGSQQQNSTYLIKFFFSLVFIIVLIGAIAFIASNDSKKDTLLYARFIADVGNR